ncbi:MAG: phosphoglucosamine mutase [Sedimentisphaerales bacterium]|jgi:phosphomannomutase
MAGELIITVSGLRGIVGENLTPQVAADYGRAFGSFLRSKSAGADKLTVCMGRDSRPSGQSLASAVTSGLTAAGIDVIDLGIVTTPTVGIMVKHLACAGGIVTTASHNPLPYNGIKLLLDNAMAPPPDVAEQIKSRFLNRDFISADSLKPGVVSANNQADDIHIAKVLRIVDQKAIAKKQFKVVLDSVNGAGGRPGVKLLTVLGCKITPVNTEPTGLFAHPPEPTAENLVSLCDAVKNAHADIGFAQDPDADRLAIVDETGTYIGEEYTLALAAKLIFSKQTGNAAANLSTSRMIDDIAQAAGGRVIRTPVGEANVASAMIKNNCVIGGEGNGGVIDLRIGPIRDSLVAMAFVLQLLAETGKTVSQLVGEIPRYYMTKQKFPADREKVKFILGEVGKLFPNARIDSADGFRFDFPEAWIHIRSSNTEPIVRIIAEAKDKAAASKYIDAVLNIAQNPSNAG